MRKKTILSVGAIAVALGVGFTAVNAGNLLSLPFAAFTSQTVPTAASYLTCTSVSPADGTVFADWNNFKEVTLDYTNANPGTFIGIAVNRGLTTPVVIQYQSGAAWVDAYEIKADDEAAIYRDAKYETRAHIVFPEALKKQATDITTNWRVVVPAGLFVTSSDGSASLNPDDGSTTGGASEMNPAVTLNYQLTTLAQYSTYPTNGQTVPMVNGGLTKASINYVEGTKVVKGSSEASAKLVIADPADTSGTTAYEEVGTYSMTIDGTNVNFTLEGVESQPVAVKSPKYYEIQIPEGLISATPADAFSATENVAINISNLNVAWLTAEDIVLTGFPPVGETLSPESVPTEFTTSVNADIALGTSYLYMVKTGTSTNIASYKGTLNADGRSITWTRLAASTSSVTILNNPQYWSNGNVTLNLVAGAIKNAAKTLSSPAVSYTWEFIDGVEGVPVVTEKINGGSQQMMTPEGTVATTKETTITSDFDAVSNDPGFGNAYLTFLSACSPNPDNLTAKMTFSKAGQAEPIWEQVNDGTYNHGHLYNARPGATTKTSSTATSIYHVYYNVDTDVQVKMSATSNTLKYKYDYLTEGGTYTIHIDKGFFIDKTGVESDEVNFTFTILAPIAATYAPASGSEVTEIKDITITYPQGAQVALNGTPEILLQNKIAEPQTLGQFSVAASGNVVTLSLEEPYTIPEKYGFQVVLPANSWNITYEGATQPNAADTYYLVMDKITAGTIEPAPCSGDETIAAIDLASIKFIPKVPVASLASNTVYLRKYVTDADFNLDYETVCLYNAEMPSDDQTGSTAISTLATELLFTTDYDLATLPSGYYDFVIPANAITYKSSMLAEEDFVYPFRVVEALTPDFTYELTPSNDEPVQSLAEITLTFPNGSYASYHSGVVGILAANDDSLYLECKYPQVSEDGKSLTFKFGNANTQWTAGAYTFTVPEGAVSINDMYYDDSESYNGNFPGFVMSYDLVLPAEEKTIADFIGYYLPSATDANRVNTLNPWGYYGMGVVAFNISDKDVKAATIEKDEDGNFLGHGPNITMTYTDEDGNSSEIASLDSGDDNVVIIVSAGGFDDILDEVDPVNTAYLLFANNGDGGIDEAKLPTFQKTGTYTITIPDGAFLYNDEPLKGATLTFNYVDQALAIDYDYELDPADGSTITLASDFYTKGIKITFTNQDIAYIDTWKQGGGHLIAPDGTEIKSTGLDFGGNWGATKSVAYLFGNAATVWPCNGQYTFKIDPNYICFNILDPESQEDCTFEGLEATFILDDSELTSVSLIGISAADAYTVYTLDGKVVKVNAAPEELKELEPGLYIINGQKVRLQK